MSSQLEGTPQVQVAPKDKEHIKKIWRVALILGVVTGFEFFCAYVMPRGVFLVVIFVSLTLVKAFYIVSEFMHLKYEVKMMIWSIILPLVFIVWLILALLTEGASIEAVRF